MNRHTLSLLTVVALVLGSSALAPARASAEDAAEEKSPPPPSHDNVVEEGVLHNTAHGLHFPVPKGYELRSSSTGEEIVLVVKGCEECILRVLVSPGNTDPLETTVRALKQQVASDPSARILDEQRTRVAREPAYTLVKEETSGPADAAKEGAPAGGAERVLTRYVTFNHGEDKYYFVLRGPSGRFGSDEDAFERMLAKLRFGL